MSNKYELSIFIGRFQPFHKGHLSVVKEALKVSDELLIIIGSHNKASDIRNPMTSWERESIILESIPSKYHNRINFGVQEDHLYNPDRWVASIQAQAYNTVHRGRSWSDRSPKIGIIGYDKDHTSYYLKMFPQWELINFSPSDIHINSTNLRHAIYNNHVCEAKKTALLEKDMCNEGAANLFLYHMLQKSYLKEEYEEIQKYKTDNNRNVFPTIFQTADAVVVQSGHILLIKRKGYPGKGHWAFPGGFVGYTETIEETVLRELKEETNIDVPVPVLKGSIVAQKTFDDPNRSVRGRTITSTFHFSLNPNYDLPKVKASDDADDAKWFTLNQFANMRSEIYEDHFSIAENMVGI